jgi:hypothetical protein
MGAAYFIVLERKIDGLETFINGKDLARQMESLDEAARRLGVRPLLEFYSIAPEQAAEFAEMDISEVNLPPLEQFSAQDGLSTVHALMTCSEGQAAIEDLKDCERILTVAAQHGVGWHFEIDV